MVSKMATICRHSVLSGLKFRTAPVFSQKIFLTSSPLGTESSDRESSQLGTRPSDCDKIKIVFKDHVIDKNTSDNLAERFIMESTKHSPLEGELHWDEAMTVIEKSEEVFPPEIPRREEVRATRPTMTLAALVNESRTLQNLVDLGVSLHEWEKRGHLGLAVKLDFDRDVAPVVRFLADLGIPHDLIGNVLTRNALLIEQEIADLKTRVAYLASKKFPVESISSIVIQSAVWLNFSVKIIDSRLGFFQKSFKLSGNEVRRLATSCPELIVWEGTPRQVRRLILAVEGEMGFSKEESKFLLLDCPDIYMQRDEERILEQFNLLHNEIGVPHEILTRFGGSLLVRPMYTKPRHEFLKTLGRAQYDPKLPLYVTPLALTDGSDLEFCQQVAKCPVDLFNQFVKTQ